MVLSIILIGFAQDLYLMYLLFKLHVFDSIGTSEEIIAFLSGFGVLGCFLSLANFLVGYTKVSDANNKRRVPNFVLGLVAFILFFGYCVFRYVSRIHENGALVF